MNTSQSILFDSFICTHALWSNKKKREKTHTHKHTRMKFDGLTRTNELLKKLNNRRRCYHSKLNNIHFVYKNIFQYYQTRQWEKNPKSNSWFVFFSSLLFVISRYCLHFVWQVFVRMKPFSLIDIPVSVQIKKRCVVRVCFWFWLSDVSAFMSFDFWWHRIMCCVLCEIDGDCCMDIKLLLWLFKWRTCEQIVLATKCVNLNNKFWFR